MCARPHYEINKDRKREREKTESEAVSKPGLSRMLNLALVPVWCGLHINDGGISASNQPPASEAAACMLGWFTDKEGQIHISTRTGQLRRPRKHWKIGPELTGSVSNSGPCFWQEISGYREHSGRASLWWTSWKLTEISQLWSNECCRRSPVLRVAPQGDPDLNVPLNQNLNEPTLKPWCDDGFAIEQRSMWRHPWGQ